jgi:GAF domain-containing protein
MGDLKNSKGAAQSIQQELEEKVQRRTTELEKLSSSLRDQDQESQITQAKLQERVQELALLNRFIFSTSQMLSLSEVLAETRKILEDELGIPGGIIFLVDNMEQMLSLKVSWGMHPSIREKYDRFPIENSHLEGVIRKRQTMLIPDLRGVPAMNDWIGQPETRLDWQSALYLPLLSEGIAGGAACLFTVNRESFSAAQIKFLETLAGEIGVVINNIRLIEELQASRTHLRRLAQRVFSAQEEERLRVSQELHDEVGQALTALRFILEMTEVDLTRSTDQLSEDKRESIRNQLRDAIQLSEQLSSGIRRLAYDLRPAELENLGLNTTLKSYCRDFANRTSLDVNYNGVETPPLGPEIDICLYSLLQ